jgi:hypothetical protein
VAHDNERQATTKAMSTREHRRLTHLRQREIWGPVRSSGAGAFGGGGGVGTPGNQ